VTVDLGHITFGPTVTASEAERYADIQRRMQFSQTVTAQEALLVQSCGCVGPQAGEKLCPCQLRAESAKGERMVRDRRRHQRH
jgi:hypothetical protein